MHSDKAVPLRESFVGFCRNMGLGRYFEPFKICVKITHILSGCRTEGATMSLSVIVKGKISRQSWGEDNVQVRVLRIVFLLFADDALLV